MYSSLNPLPFPPLSFYYQLPSFLLPPVLCTLCFFFIFILKSFYPFPNNSSPTPFDYLNLPPYYPLTPTLALLPYLLIVSPFLIFSIETPFFQPLYFPSIIIQHIIFFLLRVFFTKFELIDWRYSLYLPHFPFFFSFLCINWLD